MRHPILRWMIGIFAAIVLLCSFAVIPMACNNYKFGRFSGAVDAIPLPPDTVAVFRSKEFGLLWHSSNGCYHQARLAIASKLSFDEIKSHYAKFKVDSPDGSGDKVEASVIPFKGEPDFDKVGVHAFYPLSQGESYRWYIVEYQGYTDQGLDLRCS